MEAYGALVWIITLTPTGLLEMRVLWAALGLYGTRREKIVLLVPMDPRRCYRRAHDRGALSDLNLRLMQP